MAKAKSNTEPSSPLELTRASRRFYEGEVERIEQELARTRIMVKDLIELEARLSGDPKAGMEGASAREMAYDYLKKNKTACTLPEIVDYFYPTLDKDARHTKIVGFQKGLDILVNDKAIKKNKPPKGKRGYKYEFIQR